MQLFLSLPRFIRSVFWRIISSQPQVFKKLGGTVSMSAIGMFTEGVGWGIPISFPTLMITLRGIGEKPVMVEGRIEIREYLSLTINVDHVVDGAPATRVDSMTESLIQDALRRLLNGRTVVVIAHRLSTIRGADLIWVVREGQIVEQGKHEALLDYGGIYSALYQRQFAERSPILFGILDVRAIESGAPQVLLYDWMLQFGIAFVSYVARHFFLK